ncbi:vWA domain-containing protein [Tautonia sociabilis]|uniref:VWA domain-containing protein n=1 Tax=Tautonia sociabilis TaxID=2080755 RepID=A0A432MEG5_9BACT|nr:VWA domain-containing protein [Tautonia sociabilis]RUL83883.1 VWA domain-containing protein [Tautonia sociabilis]
MSSLLSRMRAWGADRLEDLLDVRSKYLATAYGVSVAVHLAILGLLTIAGVLMGREVARTIEASVVDTALPELERIDATELLETDQEATLEPILARSAPRFSPRIVEDIVEPDPELQIDPLSLSPSLLLPASTTLSTRVQLRGDGAEHVEGVEGAVDRLALEILRQLEKGRTLVVWIFDASGSLQSERERLAGHIGRVYENVLGRPEGAAAANGGLLTMVVAFGSGRKAMLEEPTEDTSAIADAVLAVPLDESGEESTFQTVADVARRWGSFSREKQRYRTMAIVVTDEVGDDEEKLEGAIAAARSAEMPVFVLGSSALFGRVEGYMDYTDPKTGRFYRRLPVRQGPESAALEQIRLPFWYGGPQYAELDAGFGPYGLSRLAASTGGIYFITRLGENRPSFNPAGMREYRPDWVSAAQYRAAVSRSPLRSAVLEAARITQQNLPGQPSLTFPAAGTPEFKEAMERNQQIVARVTYTVEEALGPIEAASEYRDRETSRRWQANYDLIRARLLAMKIRCYEFNWACAQMKVNPLTFSNEKSNAWRLEPDPEIHYSRGAQRAGEEARELLERVVTEHRGTPWALLAQRELRDPFGFKWVETYVPPPPPRRDDGGNAARKKARPRGEAPAAPAPKL